MASKETEHNGMCREKYWFDESIEADDALMPELIEVSDSKDKDEDNGEGEDNGQRFEEVEERDEAFTTVESVQMTGTTELYDSGCTDHISLYHNQF